MDVFYYWRDYDADLKAGRIGWLEVSRKKLDELRDRHPDWIWAFRRPKDHKGALQLLARLKWTDAPAAKLPIEKGAPAIYYDPAQSVRFPDANEEGKVAEVTSIIRTKFPNAFLASFRGDAGVHPMEADLLAQLVPKLAAYAVEPFPSFPSEKGTASEKVPSEKGTAPEKGTAV
jgi:hypothetical protein